MEFVIGFDESSGTATKCDKSLSDTVAMPLAYNGKEIKVIGNFFCQFGKLKGVDMKNTKIVTIKEEAFAYCSSLVTIIFPDSLVSIYDDAFKLCIVKEVKLPKNVQFFTGFSFNQFTFLDKIEVSIENPYFMSTNNIVFTKDMKKIVRAPGNITYDVLKQYESIDTIGRWSFSKVLIDKFVAPPSLTKIESNCFEYCTSLTDVDLIQTSISSLPAMSFYACSYLTRILLPSSITRIDARSLFGTSISSIIIPAKVSVILEDALSSIKTLKTIIYFGKSYIPPTPVILNNSAIPTVYVRMNYGYQLFSSIPITQGNIGMYIICTPKLSSIHTIHNLGLLLLVLHK